MTALELLSEIASLTLRGQPQQQYLEEDQILFLQQPWLTDTNPFLEPEKHIQTEFQIRKQERA